ncbi:zf-TFIIB domain-containing protein [Saccharophagus degradans]|uniref:TFIIB-type zinc ribbon-containing protein n=1 Tax=Saccharophagus degradans TaxID=86304 RepID=UPI001C090818|nr:zf-TFIIB domain-containing protein [Saccharophagus degradans]MBU2986148.1 zf-TFIIB domain-containing protein [Saccharophagus degradans]
MKCTSCKAGSLVPAYLDTLFPCHTCDNCGGSFVYLADYLKWKEGNPNLANLTVSGESFEVSETAQAMICPKTGLFMTKYRIASNTDHRIDLSPTINAIWMDKGEWELLKTRGLAGRLNEIFTAPWQNKIRAAKTAEVLDGIYAKEFGENYAAIKAFRELIQPLDNRAEIIAFLVSDDPYKA